MEMQLPAPADFKIPKKIPASSSSSSSTSETESADTAEPEASSPADGPTDINSLGSESNKPVRTLQTETYYSGPPLPLAVTFQDPDGDRAVQVNRDGHPSTTATTSTSGSDSVVYEEHIELSPSETDEHFMNGADELQSDNGPDRPTIRQFTLNTLRLTKLIGEERYRRLDINKYQTGVVFIRMTEKCVLPDGTKVQYTEDRTYHAYYKELGFSE